MVRPVNNTYILTMFLAICFIIFSAGLEGFAQDNHHHSKTKGAVIGGAIGAVGGAVIGGGKGAVIGGAAGAGTGALVQHHRNKKHHHHHHHHHTAR